MLTEDFLFEIGCEEMPSAPLIHATKQIKDLFVKGLDKLGLNHGEVESHSTPRRLVVFAKDVALATEEINELLRGPITSIAFKDGAPTKAAEGFARKSGISVEDLLVKTDKDGREYVFAEKHVYSIESSALLAKLCEDIIANLEWPNYRSQRWGSETQTFVRPIRWLVAMLGEKVLPIHYADVDSSNVTFGHRVLSPGAHTIANPAAYFDLLPEIHVLLEDARKAKILEGVAKIEKEHEGVRVDMPKKVFDEVVNLCEWPSVLLGAFDEEFLDVPHEIICESMLSNQRYFPIYDKDGELTREFVVVSNADPDCAATVIDGNERVVRARLDDAKFFFEEDLKEPLINNLEKLKRVVFQEKLGTVYQKAERISHLAEAVADFAGASPAELSLANRAALLAKCDLVSQAVVEFTSQQGVMGGYYAAAQGEDPSVATAIREHYRPRFAGDELPSTNLAKAVAVADKLDTVTGIFAIGEPPTGSSDPYAVRRSAIGIIAMLRALGDTDLSALIERSLSLYQVQGLDFDKDAVQKQVVDFFIGRMQSIAKDEGIPADVIEAVSAVRIVNPVVYFMRAHALDEARTSDPETFENLAIAYARAAHLCDENLGSEVAKDLMGEAEKALLSAISEGQSAVSLALANQDYSAAFAALAHLRGPIDAFFDAVLIMDDNMDIRNNRLRLLNQFVAIFRPVADISALAKKK